MTKNLPIALSMAHVMVLADIFTDNESGFVTYVKERKKFYFNKNFIIEDEIDFLSIYLSRGYNKFLKRLEKRKPATYDTSNRQNLDNYFEELYKGNVTRKPKVNR